MFAGLTPEKIKQIEEQKAKDDAAADRARGGGGTNALARIKRGAAQNRASVIAAPTTGGLISDQMTGSPYGSNPNTRSRYR